MMKRTMKSRVMNEYLWGFNLDNLMIESRIFLCLVMLYIDSNV